MQSVVFTDLFQQHFFGVLVGDVADHKSGSSVSLDLNRNKNYSVRHDTVLNGLFAGDSASFALGYLSLVERVGLRIITVAISERHELVNSSKHLDLWVSISLSRAEAEGIGDGRMNCGGAVLFFFARVVAVWSGGVLGRRNYAVELVSCVVNGDVWWVVGPVEGWEIAEDLADFLLFELFLPVVANGFSFLAVRRGEDHIVDEFGDALAVYIVEDLADDALQECLVLKFDVFEVFVSGFSFGFMISRVVIEVRVLLFGLCANEAVEVGE